jgi:hypothetical protein
MIGATIGDGNAPLAAPALDVQNFVSFCSHDYDCNIHGVSKQGPPVSVPGMAQSLQPSKPAKPVPRRSQKHPKLVRHSELFAMSAGRPASHVENSKRRRRFEIYESSFAPLPRIARAGDLAVAWWLGDCYLKSSIGHVSQLAVKAVTKLN